MIGIPTTLAIETVKRADLPIARHEVNPQRYAQPATMYRAKDGRRIDDSHFTKLKNISSSNKNDSFEGRRYAFFINDMFFSDKKIDSSILLSKFRTYSVSATPYLPHDSGG